jgi:hypothetical protein
MARISVLKIRDFDRHFFNATLPSPSEQKADAFSIIHSHLFIQTTCTELQS